MLKNSRYIIGLIIIGILVSCAGETYHIVLEDLPLPINKPDSLKYADVAFTVSVNSHNAGDTDKNRSIQSGVVDLPVGRVVTIYIYQGTDTPETGNQYRQDKYVVKTAGYLTPIYQGVSLTAGTYNVYAVSEFNNTSDKTPNFDVNKSGIATTLYNELDYLWWSKTGIEVTGETPQTIPIQFNHVATKILINCEAAAGHKLDAVTDVTLGTPNTSGCTYQLATGYITSSTTFNSSTQSATVDGFSAYSNFIPFNATSYSQLTGQAEITMNGQYGGWKSFILPLPYGKEFKAGYEYVYTVSFGSSQSRFIQDDAVGELEKVINHNCSHISSFP